MRLEDIWDEFNEYNAWTIPKCYLIQKLKMNLVDITQNIAQ